MADGYLGRRLRIDLMDRSIGEEGLSVDDLKKFIGGSSLSSRILFSETGGRWGVRGWDE